MNLLKRSSVLFALLGLVVANTEKLIFTAPRAIIRTEATPSLASLYLDKLTPAAPSIRTALAVQFQREETSHGTESWFLIEDLVEEFELDAYNITHVFDSPELIQSLASFSAHRIEGSPDIPSDDLRATNEEQQTVLFLRIRSSADFFTSNEALMLSPPPVHVDLILDPYLAKILPGSLVTTLVYISLLRAGESLLVMTLPNDHRTTSQRAQASVQAHASTLSSGSATPPLHPFYSLPSELILDIVDLLPPEAFINFAFANYPLLHAYGLAPALSRPRVVYITTQTTIPALFPLLRMPAEIMLNIMRNLKPIDTMRFVVANYQDLSRQGIAPPLTEVMVRQLRSAVGVRPISTGLEQNHRPCTDL
nr:hypothetical protein CFP56_13102 [Quercus suber]